MNNQFNLRVLVTRPLHQAVKLCQLIEANGGQVILCPTLAIEFLNNEPSLLKLITNLASQVLAIFISPNAVQGVHLLLQQQAITWPEYIRVAAVGPSTAQALASININVALVPEQFNSESLLALPALQNVRNKSIIIFRGEGGRELLSTVLQDRGAVVTEAVVYRRVMPASDIQNLIPAWQANGVDIIVATSNTGLQNLINMVGEEARNWLMNMPLLVISERMAKFAKESGFVKKPIVADNATDEAILNALIVNFKLGRLRPSFYSD